MKTVVFDKNGNAYHIPVYTYDAGNVVSHPLQRLGLIVARQPAPPRRPMITVRTDCDICH